MKTLNFNEIYTEVNKSGLYKFYSNYETKSYDKITLDTTVMYKTRADIKTYINIIRLLIRNEGEFEVTVHPEMYLDSPLEKITRDQARIASVLLYINDKKKINDKDLKKLTKDLFFEVQRKKFHTNELLQEVEKEYGNRLVLTYKPVFHLYPEELIKKSKSKQNE